MRKLVITQLDLRNRHKKDYDLRITLTQKIRWGNVAAGRINGRIVHGGCTQCGANVSGEPHVICEQCGRVFCANCAESSIHECPYCEHKGSPA